MTSRAAKRAAGPDLKKQEELRISGEIPRHIAIIMDGNGRWAKQRGLPRIAGHREGVESVRDIVESCGQIGVGYLTLYAFSTENWKRPKDEVSMLMRLLMKALRDETDKLHKNNVRVRTIGDTSALPQEVQDELFDTIERTRDNTGLTLLLALSYSGRWDLTMTMRRIAAEVQRGTLLPDDVTDGLIGDYLSTHGTPDPDLLIRTSGEMRISNFLLWQVAYAEIYISRSYWPDFRREELYRAIQDFQQRERRFGMVSEQVTAQNRKPGYVHRILKSVSK